jgi:hypothetical protein
MPPGRWLVCAALVAAVASLGLYAEEPAALPADLTTLIADARGLPSEFAADTLIRLSGLSRLSPAIRRELLEEAFMRAYAAHEDYRRSTTTSLQPESRQSAQRLAFDTGLTRLTLQARAAQLLAFTDAPRARELFDWIDLKLAPGVCEDPLVPAVDEYYSALSLVARTAFGADRTEAMRFFERHLWRARLPSELPAVARAVQRFRPTLDEAIYLESVVRWILDGSARDPRGFSSANLDIVSRVADLQQADHRQGVPGWYLLDGLRDYLLSQLAGSRCADSATEEQIAPAFNGVVSRLGAGFEVDRIDDRTVRPAKLLAAARIDYYWQTPDSWRLYRNEERLRTDGKTVFSMAVRQTKEWYDQADLLLTDIDQWPGRREASDRDFFYQKGVLFTGLVDLAPPGVVRTRGIHAFVDFLRHTDTDRDRRPLWLALLNRFLELARSDPSREIFAALEESRHPVLSVYARLERATARRSALNSERASLGFGIAP